MVYHAYQPPAGGAVLNIRPIYFDATAQRRRRVHRVNDRRQWWHRQRVDAGELQQYRLQSASRQGRGAGAAGTAGRRRGDSTSLPEAGGTWFWWSKEGGAQYVKLWKYAFDYLTNTKGLKGILWLMPYDGTPQASFYPGKAFVDIAGADNYNAALNYAPMTNIFNATAAIAGPTIPIALHENGPIPDPD